MNGLNDRRRGGRDLAATGLLVALLLLITSGCGDGEPQRSGEAEFVSLFDGASLEGWDGDSTYWRVEQGVLVGEVTPATLLERNSFIVWQGDVPADFELSLEYRISEDGNSGINYRSERVDGVPHALRGYQADLDGAKRYVGSNYEERRRTTLASIGEKVTVPAVDARDPLAAHIEANHWTPSQVQASLGDPDTLRAQIDDGGWNAYRIRADGNRLRHYVNGVLMSDVTDNDTVHRRADGLLGVQVHVGPPMKVEYRNLRLKDLTHDE
jgi:hypothetical protein